jgi:hypothetical protein
VTRLSDRRVSQEVTRFVQRFIDGTLNEVALHRETDIYAAKAA